MKTQKHRSVVNKRLAEKYTENILNYLSQNSMIENVSYRNAEDIQDLLIELLEAKDSET